MELSQWDVGIIVCYFLLTVFIGYFIAKRASKNLDSYFLGGKTIPWYILGVSNASGMFDITGTMWMVSLAFIYGVKSVWIPWLWPVWNQVFLMIFLAVWLRRSNVLTGAEWLTTRFGKHKGTTQAHIVVVIFAIIAVVGFITYGFEGIGKFTATFMPWDLSFQVGGFMVTSAKVYAMIVMGFTTLYVIKGGMYSVVMTELLQFVIMTVACIAVGCIALYLVSPEMLLSSVPEGWTDLHFGWSLGLDWSERLPALNSKIIEDGYDVFGALLMMMLFKGFLVSVAGPAPSYDMQRILATRSPKEAAKMSGIVSLVLFIPRYLMIFGLAAIALVFLQADFANMGDTVDFELILPMAVRAYIPVGFKGLFMAGLISAFMSTFAANVNAGPAYIVNDLYRKYINPQASDKRLIRMSYLASFAIVLVGIFFGLFVSSIDSVLKWIVGALFGGYTSANLLKWIWWRFNAQGYFWGMISGLVTAVAIPLLMPSASVLISFPLIFGVSMLFSVGVSLATPPEDMQVLKSFYASVRPWGFWRPVEAALRQTNPDFKPNTNFRLDLFNCLVGIIWQLSLHLIPVYLIIGDYLLMSVSIGLMVVSMWILKVKWWDKLEDYPADLATTQQLMQQEQVAKAQGMEATAMADQ